MTNAEQSPPVNSDVQDELQANKRPNWGCWGLFVILAVIPAGIMLATVVWAFRVVPTGDPTVCSVEMTDVHRVRLQSQPVRSGYDDYLQQTFYFTDDGGREWRELMQVVLRDVTPAATCDGNIGAHEEDVIWAWSGNQLVVSATSGIEWHTLDVCTLLDNRIEDCSANTVTLDVDFNFFGVGDVVVNADSGQYRLQTVDGGVTWRTSSQ